MSGICITIKKSSCHHLHYITLTASAVSFVLTSWQHLCGKTIYDCHNFPSEQQFSVLLLLNFCIYTVDYSLFPGIFCSHGFLGKILCQFSLFFSYPSSMTSFIVPVFPATSNLSFSPEFSFSTAQLPCPHYLLGLLHLLRASTVTQLLMAPKCKSLVCSSFHLSSAVIAYESKLSQHQ